MHVALKVARALEHVAQDALGRELVVVGPGHLGAVLGKGAGEHLFERLGVGDLLQALEALLVVDAVCLHSCHGAVALGALLCAQHLLGVLERGLHHADEIERVGLALGVEQFERGQQEGRERLVEGKILGQVDREGVVDLGLGVCRRIGGRRHLGTHHDAGVDQCGEDLVCSGVELELLLVGLQARGDELAHVGARVAALLHHGEHHGVRDAQARLQRLGLCLYQALEGLLVPRHKALGRFFLLDAAQLFGVVAGLGHELSVLDIVLGGLGDHHALGVKARAPGAAGDLVELACAQAAHAVAVELGERGEHHGVDGHVDAHAQGVGAADDGQQALLGELFHQQTVARQHAGMVHAHTAREQALQDLAERGGELGAARGLLDLLALLLAGNAEVCERLCGGERGVLAEVHDVERGLAAAQRQLDGAFQRGVHVLVGEGHGARRVRDQVDLRACLALERLGDLRDVAECGAHQHELRMGQGEQGHLPGPAAVGVGKVVELVHGDAAHVGVLALAQGLVGQDLGGAADHGRRRVDVRVAGDHAHVVAPQHLDEVEELLGDERLDGRGVVGALTLRHAHEEHAERHERLARARGRAQDHVVAGGEVHEGLFLVLPQLDAAVAGPLEEALEGGVGGKPGFGLAAVFRFPPGGGELAERAELAGGVGAACKRACAARCGGARRDALVGHICMLLSFAFLTPSIMAEARDMRPLGAQKF